MHLLPQRQERARALLLFLLFLPCRRRRRRMLRGFVEGVVPCVLRRLQLGTECTSTIPVTRQDSLTHRGA